MEGIDTVEVARWVVDHAIADDFDSTTLSRWVDQTAEAKGLDQLFIGRTNSIASDQIVDRDAHRDVFIRIERLVGRHRWIVLVQDRNEDRSDGGQRIKEVSGDSVVDDRVGKRVVSDEVRQGNVSDQATDESNATASCRKGIDREDRERLIALVGRSWNRSGDDHRAWDFQALVFIDRVGKVSCDRWIVDRTDIDQGRRGRERIEHTVGDDIHEGVLAEVIRIRDVIERSISTELEYQCIGRWSDQASRKRLAIGVDIVGQNAVISRETVGIERIVGDQATELILVHRVGVVDSYGRCAWNDRHAIVFDFSIKGQSNRSLGSFGGDSESCERGGCNRDVRSGRRDTNPKGLGQVCCGKDHAVEDVFTWVGPVAVEVKVDPSIEQARCRQRHGQLGIDVLVEHRSLRAGKAVGLEPEGDPVVDLVTITEWLRFTVGF